MDTSELYHYGVPGMKWGIRKYVNYDGSLTAEGKKKYGTYSNFYKAYTQNKKGLKNDKQVILEAKYKSQGMDDKTAEIKAIGKRQTDKTIAIVGGVTVAAAAAAVAGKMYYDYAADKTIGTDKDPVHRMEFINKADGGHKDNGRLHVYLGNKDKAKYDGTWARDQIDTARAHHQNTEGYKPNHLDISLNNGAGGKLASDKSIKTALNDFKKSDPDSYKNLTDGKTKFDDVLKEIGRAQTGYHISGGKSEEANAQAYGKFEKLVKSKGFDAITDYNDRYNYMKSRAAVIIDDPTTRKTTMKEISEGELNKLATKGYKQILDGYGKQPWQQTLKDLAISIGPTVAAGSGVALTLGRTKTARATRMYNAGASYKEIAKALGVPVNKVGGYIQTYQ